MRFRLVALDLDGTALDPDSAIRPAVRRSVAAVRARGVRVVICTGRRLRSARPYARELGLDGAAVLHHGALVKDLASGETRVRTLFDGELYAAALALLRAVRPPIVYVDGYPGGPDIVSGPIVSAHPAHQRYLAKNGPAHRIAEDLTAPEEGALALALIDDEARLRALREELSAELGARAVAGVYPTYWGGHLLEVVPSSVSKWRALRALAAEVGVAPEEILAIGDELNDLDMLRNAGLGVAMGNARDACKEVAGHVTASNDEDGVARALERFVLDAE